jgi:hypothetical protein
MTSFLSKEPKVFEFSLLSWLVTGSSICFTRTTEQHGDNIRDVKYGMRFISLRNNLGSNGYKSNFSMPPYVHIYCSEQVSSIVYGCLGGSVGFPFGLAFSKSLVLTSLITTHARLLGGL